MTPATTSTATTSTATTDAATAVTAGAATTTFDTMWKAEAADDTLRLMVGLLDLQDGARPVRRLRDWALAAVRRHPGSLVVDLGSGTGTMTRELAALVGPGGRAYGVEPNPHLRALAQERARAEGSTAEFVAGEAGALPYADASVDLVWCERVLQHLTDPQRAIDDIARVLRPGGVAVLLDSDHGSRVTSDLEPDVERIFSDTFLAATANPRAARLIRRQAGEAGLQVDPDVGSAALLFDLPDPARSLLGAIAAQAVAQGTLSQEKADAALQAFAAASAQGYAFTAVTMFGFVCRAPHD